MKKILILIVGLVTYCGLNAQSETFGLLFSQYGLNGTAAYIGKAGAIGALGGDIMAAHYNPAGLGIYRSSEMTISLGMDVSSSNAEYNFFRAKDSHPTFNFGNVGFVWDIKMSKKNPFKHFQVSMGVNRLMNFNRRAKIVRENLSSSYINDYVIDNIINNNDATNDFITSGVIDLDQNTNTLSSVYENGTFDQIKSIRESGYLNEFALSFSTNYENFLYLGATVGVPFGSYTSETSFAEERFINGQSTGYYNYNTEQDLDITGVNFKFGAIVRPVEWLRLGAAIHTPTWYFLTDDYFSEVQYNRTRGGWFPEYEYDMYSPWRFMLNGALILGNSKDPVSGTLSVDYEYADYGSMSFTMDDNIRLENQLNNNIENAFGSSNTFRVGGELKSGILRARAGYAHMGNPYQNENDNNQSWDYITFGLGVRDKTFSFDIAYAYAYSNDGKYYMYDVINPNSYTQSPVNTENKKHLIQATFGMRF